MGLISGLVLWPLAPVRGVTWVAEQIEQEALRQWSDPAVIQQELLRIDDLRQRGEIDDDEADEREEELLQRLSGAWPDQGLDLTYDEREADG